MTHFPETLSTWMKRLDLRVVIVALILAFYALVWKSFDNFIIAIDHCPISFCDFRQFYYPAGRAVLEQTSLPNGFYYSSFAAVLFVPFSLLPMRASLIVWGIVQAAAAIALFLLPTIYWLKDKAARYVYTGLFFTSAALLNNFKWGQISTLMILGVFTAFLLYTKGKTVWSAVLLGAVIALKFYPAIFLLVFLFKRDWKYLLLCGLATVCCLVVVPALAMGPAQALRLQLASGTSLTKMVSSVALINTDTQYFASVLMRYFKFPVSSPPFIALTIFGYLVVLFVFYLAYRVSRSSLPAGAIWAACLLWMTVPFWIPSAWPHYFVFLPIVQALVFQEIGRSGEPVHAGMVMLWLVCAFFSSILAELALRDWFVFAWLGLILWSNLTALGLSWFVLRKRLSAGAISAA
jgi:hypothetical protein